MWPYKEHKEEDYRDAVALAESIAVKYGAVPVSVTKQKFSTMSGDWTASSREILNVYKYGGEFFRIEPHYLPQKPFMVFSFGDTIESIFEDAEPFPYDLSEKELEQEVRYSLGIDSYPEYDG